MAIDGRTLRIRPWADDSGRVAVRHSQRPEESIIVYTRAEWVAFLAGVNDGEFDFNS
ncbi:MAG TPA: DUF397 domain-containing protein [Glycomyces sp.]|nr:DUF397 domain-containing protein [Glycomyces sp.]